ncbi:MAG TPA: VWA domain-containing protein, partial [Gemmataceae bacterium]|nr:VWA domain-containing protein [Gemmataceae bacterium]
DGPSLDGMPVGEPAVVEWQPPAAAFAADNPQAARDRTPGAHARGRVVLVTSTANMDWNSWPASPSYLAFMQELMRFAVAGRLREQAVTVGDPLEEFLAPGAGALDAVITTPDQRSESTRTLSSEDTNVLRWADTDVSGVYRVVLGRDPQEHLFAVNVPAATSTEEASESDLARATRDDLSRAYPEWDPQLVTDLGEVNHTGGPSAAAEKEREYAPIGPGIAHYFLLAVLALLFAEVIMAWQFGHYSGTPGNEQIPSAGIWLPSVSAVLVGLALVVIGGTLVHFAWTGDFLGFLPDVMRRGVEALLGIPPPAPGEGSHWRLEFDSFLWDDPVVERWLVALIALAGIALVFLIYRQEAKTANRALRMVMVGLRVAMLCLMLVIAGQPKLWFERQGWPDVVILIDDSLSMSTVDHYQDERVRAAADALAKDANLSQQDRLSLAKALVSRSGNDWLANLLNTRKTKIHVYHCSTRAARIADISESEHLTAAAEGVKQLDAGPQNDSSQLGTAVRQVINDFRGSSLSAVIMLTDGVTTEGEDLGKVAKYASQMGVPLFFVGLGDAQEPKDLYLHDLQSEESVYVNDNIIFTVRLTGQGFGDLTVPVELREKGKDKVLDSQNVKVDPSGKPEKVRLNYRPKEEGEKVFELRVPVQEGEANVENNVVERTVYVRKTKVIKVLYVEGEPRWEFRYVKTLLERENQRVEGNKSFDLKVLLLDADPQWAEQDKSALVEFPPKNELQAFDVVVLGDFDPQARWGAKANENLQNVADFVKERGGGLLVVAGPHYAPHCYKGTPLQDVLPIDILTERQPAEPPGGLADSYRPELTPVGRMHPIFSFSNDENENNEIYNGLKEMYWWSEGYTAKRAAEVLAVHPRVRAAGAKGAKVRDAGFDGHPLVVQQFVGSGRSLFFGIDETWRWRWREDELHFNQFWVQTMRYLARSRSGKVELRLDKQTPYRRGEPIRVTVRFPDDAPPPPAETEVKVVVERRPPRANGAGDVDVQTITLAKVEGSRSNFEALLTRTPEGDYHFWLQSPQVPGPRPKAECKVLAPPGEMEVLRMNQAEMERAAEETHGRFYTLANADEVLTDLPAGVRVTLNASGPPMHLWNGLWVFGLALAFLTLEWVLRKRKNLL